MKERRSLVEGLKPDPELQKLEEDFVFGEKKRPEMIKPRPAPISEPEVAPTAAPDETTAELEPVKVPPLDTSILPQMHGRIPVTTRCRPELASTLKRASLQRQLAGAEPYYVQDIMEQALESWLRDKGYIA